MQLIRQFQALNGIYRIIHTVGGAFRFLPAKHHFRVVDKILIDCEAVLGLPSPGPVRYNIQRAVPLLQEDNVGYDLGPGVLFESVIGQTDGSQQLRPLRQIPAHRGIFGIHRIAAGNESNYTARTHLV